MVQKTAVVVALGLAAAAAAAAMPPQRPFQGRSFSMDREGWGFEKEEVDEATGLITTSFRSPPLRLDDGQVIFTDPQSTPMRMPTGDFKYAITSFGAEVVDSQNRSTPLSEVYNHHWLMFRANKGNSGLCGGYLDYMFGVGAESRKTYARFPSPYAVMADGSDEWFANIHVIRTVNVPNVTECIECWCPGGGAGFSCCPDGHRCATKDAPAHNEKTYYLRYFVTWAKLDTPAGKALTPVDIYVLDASNCNIEYNIDPCPAGTPPDSCTNTLDATFKAPRDMDVVFTVGHVHIGGINITTYLNDQPSGPVLCTSYPVYGNGTEAGNEKGYVVQITTCPHSKPVHIAKGDPMYVESVYHADRFYGGVMGLVYVAALA